MRNTLEQNCPVERKALVRPQKAPVAGI